jgi:hypothetical protein
VTVEAVAVLLVEILAEVASIEVVAVAIVCTKLFVMPVKKTAKYHLGLLVANQYFVATVLVNKAVATEIEVATEVDVTEVALVAVEMLDNQVVTPKKS